MKLAVIFPGIGYHTDKPLLYYSKKIAKKYGFDIKDIYYGNFSKDVKESREKMHEAYLSALKQTEDFLSGIEFSKYNEIIFISKSIGTAVAVSFASKHRLSVKHILYTPVEETFTRMENENFQMQEDKPRCIAFHGTNDPWIKSEIVMKSCKERKIPLYILENADHSLETGDLQKDISNLNNIMMQSELLLI